MVPSIPFETWANWINRENSVEIGGRMFFQILVAIAEFEHALMSERTLDGLEAARARGRTGARSR